MSQSRVCTITGKQFVIPDEEATLLGRMGLPLPTLSPEERLRSLMASRNEWKLYRRTCDATGAEILSAFPPESPFTVYRNDIWWGDTWDALSFGQPFDARTPFFEQFRALQAAVPREGTSVFRSENCDYNSHIRDSRNCYMNSLIAKSEDTHFSYWIENGKDVVDSMYTNFSTLTYECRDCVNCYDTVSLEECSNCNDCHFSYQLIGCSQCLFCSNLSNKTLHLHNKPCSREEFDAAKERALHGSYRAWKEARASYASMRSNAIHRAVHTMNCQDVTGDHFYNARNCISCFDGHDSESCFHSISVVDSNNIDSAYSAGWPGCEVVYFSAVSRGSQDIAFCRYTWFSNDLRYCDSCISCKHCFGCIGLRHKEYCILNRQYTKEEYETLVRRIIEHMEGTGEWGMFLPPSSMPFAYNETAAQDWFPLSREEALARGFRWRDAQEESPAVKKVVAAAQLPDSIADGSDDLLQWAVQCEVSGKPFRIVKQELDFYRRMHLPIPRIHPMERHKARMAQRNPDHLWERICPQCKQPTLSTYDPERPETVYCEECYLKEVY